MGNRRKRDLLLTLGIILLTIAGIIVGVIFWLKNADIDTKKKFSGRWAEFVFNKTVDDFPGRMIDNLDDDSTTNFIVYAKGVRRVKSENGSNRVLSVDNENLIYHIDNPDVQLEGLQNGDVFFIEPNEYCAEGLSVKVDTVTLQDDGILIKGKELKLKDLIEYADVDMEFPINTFYLDKNEASGAQVKWVDGSKEVVAENSNSETVPFWKYELPFGEFEQPGKEVSTGFNVDWSNLHLEGRGGVRFENIRYMFKVRPALFTAIMGTQVDPSVFLRAEAKATASGSLPIKYPSIIVPLAGPLVFHFTPGISVDFEGSAGVSAEWKGGMHASLEMSYTPFIGLLYRDGDAHIEEYAPEVKLGEFSASVSLNMMEANASFGVPYVTTLYEAFRAGIVMEGVLKIPSEEENNVVNAESLHKCEACVDGKTYIQVRLDAGVALDFANLWRKKGTDPKAGGVMDFDGSPGTDPGTAVMRPEDGNIYDYGDSKSWRISDWSWSIVDVKEDFPIVEFSKFYFSIKKDTQPEFGWGECPYRAWRTEIQVVDEDTRPVSGVLVTAVTSDGEKIEPEYTEQNGKVVLYLPNGQNQLHGEFEGQTAGADIFVEKAPASATLELETNRRLFVIYDFTSYSNHAGEVVIADSIEDHIHDGVAVHDKEFSYTELKERLMKQYHVEQFIPLEEWKVATTPEERKEQFGYLESDCFITIESGRGSSFLVRDSGETSVYCASFDFSGITLMGWRGNKDFNNSADIYGEVSSWLYSDSFLEYYMGIGAKIVEDDSLVIEEIGSTDGGKVEYEYFNLRDAVKNSAMSREAGAQLFEAFFPQIDEMLYGE